MEKKKYTLKEKLLFAASTVGVVAVFVLATTQVLGIWQGAVDLYLPITGLVLLCMTEYNKEKNPSISKVCMVSAVVIFAVLLLNIIL